MSATGWHRHFMEGHAFADDECDHSEQHFRQCRSCHPVLVVDPATARDTIEKALLDHRDSSVTTVTDEDEERIAGASAWCYCGGWEWDKEATWRGTFNAPGQQAERELRRHIADAVLAALAGEVAE